MAMWNILEGLYTAFSLVLEYYWLQSEELSLVKVELVSIACNF